MKVSIPATCGEPYTVQRSGRWLYKLSRRNSAGRNHVIVCSKDDAIAICNALVDLIEQDNP